MRNLFLLPVLLGFAVLLGQPVVAAAVANSASPLQLTYQAASLPSGAVSFQRLTETPLTYAVTGLPFPGEILWRPTTTELAYRHPVEVSWLLMDATMLPATISTSLAGRAAGPIMQGAPSRRWQLRANSHDCGVLFGSAQLGQRYGVTVRDLQIIHQLLYWANTSEAPSGCNAPLLPTEAAARVGLPTRWQSPWGLLVLSTIEASQSPSLPAWPTHSQPLDLNARLRLLLIQLPVPARAEFLRAARNLPLAAQVATLARSLSAASAAAAP